MDNFILLDCLDKIVLNTEAHSTFSVPENDDIYKDHFPGNPLFPGSLLVEVMAQTAGWLLYATNNQLAKTALLGINNARFRQWVKPSSNLSVKVSIEQINSDAAVLSAKVFMKDECCASAELMMGLYPLDGDNSFASNELREWAKNTFTRLGGHNAILRGQE